MIQIAINNVIKGVAKSIVNFFLRVTENGDYRVTENGDYREIE
jgi:hypothetical protein